MKEIWINLELYIKRYDFCNLGNFSGFLNHFSYFIFDFKTIFKPFSNGFSRGPHVDATWHARPRGSGTQGHVAAPRGPAQCLRGA